MWNLLKKKSSSNDGQDTPARPTDLSVGGKDMGIFQKFAMKRLEKMSPAEREKLMKKAMTPKNIEKHKGEIKETLDAMKAAGQISDDQYRLAKKRFNI